MWNNSYLRLSHNHMNQNQTFTDKHLASLAAIMLLAPAVSFMLKENNIDIKADEESYVRSYIRYGYYVLMVLALGLIVWATYSLFLPINILYRINYWLLGGVIAMIIIGVFAIINNKTLIDRTAHNTTTGNPAVLVYYIPLYNYYLRYNEPLDEHTYRRVKESVLLWSVYLILVSVFPTAGVIFMGLFVIIARCVMVTVGMDILSFNAKNTINKRFYRNIEEFIAYPLSILLYPVKKLFGKGSTLNNEVESWKRTYSHLDKLSHWRTILSYIIALWAIGYRGYITRLSSGPTVWVSLALMPQILWIGKILMSAPSGTLPRIPILYSLLGWRKDAIAKPAEAQKTAAPATQTPITAASNQNKTI